MAVAISAVAAAIEVTTVASVLSAVAAVGMATSVAGIVTGKPNLIKIGGELGLVGGLGGLANSALQSLGTSALKAGGAGVAEGALEAPFSDVAGEKYALSVGQDAAGSGFATGAGGAAGSAAEGLGSSLGASGDLSGIINSAQKTAQAAGPSAADITAVNGSPVSFGTSFDLSGTDLATKPNGMLSLPDTSLADAASPTLPSGTADYSDLPQKYGTDNSTLEKIKSSIGKAWDSLSPNQKDMLVKQALATPAGIQAQHNKERELDIMEQRTKQSSYGSSVPTFGIISKVQKG